MMMIIPSAKLLLLVLTSRSLCTTSAFTIARPHARQLAVDGASNTVGLGAQVHSMIHRTTLASSTILLASKSKGKGFAKDDAVPNDENDPNATATASQQDEEEDKEDPMDNENSLVTSTMPQEEDPVVTALKEEIKNAESELKAKKSTLSRIEEDVEKYTKSGYARRVAQMEDMKRIRLTMQSSNKEASKAAVIQNFIPVMDDLRRIQDELGDAEFGKKYSGLSAAMTVALKEMGVEDYTVAVGDVVNPQKVATIDEEYSSEVPKGSIIRPVSMGMELAGNVLRLAQAVVSMGPAPDGDTNARMGVDDGDDEAVAEEEADSEEKDE